MPDNGKTKYVILMEDLKERILSGQIRPGDRMPSENELAESNGISRHTVRKALAILENEEHGRNVESYPHASGDCGGYGGRHFIRCGRQDGTYDGR